MCLCPTKEMGKRCSGRWVIGQACSKFQEVRNQSSQEEQPDLATENCQRVRRHWALVRRPLASWSPRPYCSAQPRTAPVPRSRPSLVNCVSRYLLQPPCLAT